MRNVCVQEEEDIRMIYRVLEDLRGATPFAYCAEFIKG